MIANNSNKRINSPAPKIKLASVRSHSLNKVAQKSPGKPTNGLGFDYHKVFFLTAAHNDYNIGQSQQEYEEVLSILHGMRARASAFAAMKDLQSRQIFKGKKRYLILTATDQRSLRILDAVRKKDSKNVDIVMLGQLKPNSQFLSDIVKLATDNAEQVLKFMSQNGLQSPEMKTYLAERVKQANRMSELQSNFMRTFRESSESSSQRTTLMMNRLSIKRPEHHWVVDKDKTTSKFTTTEIFNPLTKENNSNGKQEMRKQSESSQSENSQEDNSNEKKQQPINQPKRQQIKRQIVPTEIQVPSTTAQYSPRSYETKYENYQQPRVIRKEVTLPEQVRPISQKNTTFQNKAIYQPTSNTSQQITVNYLPSNYRAINSTRVSETLQTSPRQLPPTPTQPRITSSGINLDDYDRIQQNGMIIYRKKLPTSLRPKE